MCAPADIFLGLIAIIFPPLPVWIKTGICSGASFLNLLLLILGYIPGLLHSWYIIAAVPEPSSTAYYYEEISDAEAGRAGARTRYEHRVYAPARRPDYAYYIVRVPGPDAAGGVHGGPGVGSGANAAQGYVAPPPQLGPAGRSYGATDAQVGPSSGEQVPQGAPPSYDQAVKGDNKVQK